MNMFPWCYDKMDDGFGFLASKYYYRVPESPKTQYFGQKVIFYVSCLIIFLIKIPSILS